MFINKLHLIHEFKNSKMKRYRKGFLGIKLLALVGITCLPDFTLVEAQNTPVRSITAISEVFGDGQKVSAVALEYDQAIDGNTLSPGDYSVEGRTVNRVYTNDRAGKSGAAVPGNYVVVELDTGGEAPALPTQNQGLIKGPEIGAPSGSSSSRKRPEPVTYAVVAQTGDISTVTGEVYVSNLTPMRSTREVCLIVDDFTQSEYLDPATGIALKYNLYVPENYDPSRTYPLVLFIHDASGAGKAIKNTLTQGLGAVVWASPEEQAKHPCFVLAPQYDVVTVDDNFNTTPDLDATLALIHHLMETCSIDRNRVYTTGQSMGCMSSIVLMLREPELFASAYLVAGQWNPAIMGPLAKKPLWIITSQGDLKASSGMDAAVKVWEELGGRVSEALWDPQATPARQAEAVAAMVAEDTNIKYPKFIGGSHNYTWQIAYAIPGIRDWLFSQVKE